MKNYKNLIFGLIILFTVSNCSEDDLDLAPVSQLTTGNFYLTPTQIDQALTGAYNGLRSFYSSGDAFINTSECSSKS